MCLRLRPQWRRHQLMHSSMDWFQGNFTGLSPMIFMGKSMVDSWYLLRLRLSVILHGRVLGSSANTRSIWHMYISRFICICVLYIYIYVTYNIRTYINYILIYLYVSKWHTIANLLVFTNLTFEVQKLSGLLAMSGAAHQQLKEMDFGDIMGNPRYMFVSKKPAM